MQIHAAAASGNRDSVRRQLDRGVPVDVRCSGGKTPLMHACASNTDLSMLRLLLDAGADPNATTKDSLERTPLMEVTCEGGFEKIKCLIDAGANAAYVAPGGYNALYKFLHAETAENLKAIELLIKNGCDPDLVSSYQESALRVAIHCGNRETARTLIQCGADREIAGLSSLGWAVLLGSLADVQTEIENGADLEYLGKSNMAPWILAVAIGELEKAKCLHKSGSSIDQTGRHGATAMNFAARRNDVALCEWLIAIGCSIDKGNVVDSTPLEFAAAAGSMKTLEYLIQAGAKHKNDDGNDAIVVAKNSKVSQMLIAHGSDIDAINRCGEFLLNTATAGNQIGFVADLLKQGANPNNETIGYTALHTAIRCDHTEIARMLIQAGASVDVQDVDNWTPLMYAPTLESVDLLLHHGARIDLTDDVGETVIGRCRDPEILDRLLQANADPAVAKEGLGDSLRRSSEDGELESVKLLLSRGADVDAATGWGKTSLMEAAEHHHFDVLQHLILAGASLDLKDEDGRTALTHAAASECLVSFKLGLEKDAQWLAKLETLEAAGHSLDSAEVQALRKDSPYGYFPNDDDTDLKALVDAGANIEARDNEGATALTVACQFGRPSQVAALIRLGADLTVKDSQGRSAKDITHLHHSPRQAELIRGML